jgi:hypothetical protein
MLLLYFSNGLLILLLPPTFPTDPTNTELKFGAQKSSYPQNSRALVNDCNHKIQKASNFSALDILEKA